MKTPGKRLYFGRPGRFDDDRRRNRERSSVEAPVPFQQQDRRTGHGRAGKQDAVVEGLFRAYFLDGRDIGDSEVLANVAAAGGLDQKTIRDYLARRDDVDRVENEDAIARRMGIQGVPCFILNRKYAISGAQEPAVFLEALEMLRREAVGEGEAVSAPANT